MLSGTVDFDFSPSHGIGVMIRGDGYVNTFVTTSPATSVSR